MPRTPLFTRAAGLACLVFLDGCLSLELPPKPPPPGPGTLQGRVVYAVPGQTGLVPAVGTRISVLSTGVEVTVTDAEGRFVIPNLTEETGDALFSFDGDGDGQADRQRLLSLKPLGVGPGRDVSIGDLVLGRNARVEGQVRRGDLAALPTGHAGTTVFVPSTPFLTFTADDGSFALDQLPEGTYAIAFFRAAYAADSTPVNVGPGQLLRLRDLVLVPAPGGVEPARASGSVKVIDGSADGVKVTLAAARQEQVATSSAEGRYGFEGLAPGVYSVGYEKAGWLTVTVQNVLLGPGSNTLALVTLRSGASRPAGLDGGPPRYDGGAGAGGGTAGGAGGGAAGGGATAGGGAAGGGATGGGAAGGGATGGGSAAGGSAGGGSAGGVATGGGTAGGSAGGVATGGGTAGGSAGGGSSGGGTAGGVVTGGGAAGGVAGGAAGGSSMGGGMAGGVSGPVARIAPNTIFAAPDASVLLNGTSSTGDMPLTYRWSQDGGVLVALSVNNSPGAATPGFRAPAPGTVLQFGLRVEDSNGVLSAPAFATVRVARPPVAAFTGSDAGLTTVFSGQPLPLNASASFDRDGLVLAGYRWFQTAGPAGAFVPGDQVDTLFTAPTVTADTLVTVALEVTNSVGMPSAPATRSFNVRPGSAFAWSIDAGPTQAVNVPQAGALVTLRGAIQTTASGATFTSQWTQLSGPSVALSDAGVLEPQFLMPVVAGASQQLQFRLVVTSTSGLSPPTQQGDTLVIAHDVAPPTVVFNEASDGFSPVVSTTVVFSEPVQLANGTPVTVSGRQYSTPRFLGERMSVVHNPPLTENGTYTLTISADPFLSQNRIKDLAGNELVLPMPVTFVARREWSGLFMSASDSTLEPRPGIMELTQDSNPSSRVQLVARRPNGSSNPSVWVLQPFDPFDASCANDAGVCVLLDAPSPSVTLNPAAPSPPLHKGMQTPTFSAALVQLKDFQNATETLYLLADGGVFQPSPPGAMFSNGSGLYSTYVDATGLHAVQLDPFFNTWTLNDELISNDTVAFSSDATSFPLSQGYFESDTISARRAVFARTSKSNTAVMYARATAGPWAAVSVSSVTPTSVTSIRALRADDRSGSGSDVIGVGRSSAPYLVTRSEHTGWGGAIPESGWSLYPSAATFDLAHLNGVAWTAFVANDDLFLAWCASQTGGACNPVFIQAPGGGAALDANPVCSPAHPELTVVRSGLVLTWQERCGAGPWKVYARGLR